MLGAGLDAAVHAERRHRRRIARLAHQARDVRCLGADELHVGRAGAHVLGRDVAAAQRLHVTAVRAENRLAVLHLVVADDDAFAAAQVQSRHRRLVRHAARQAQRVDQRGCVALVVPEARAAERRAKLGVVDRDDAAVARRRIGVKAHLLVPVFGELGEQVGTAAVGARRRASAGDRVRAR